MVLMASCTLVGEEKQPLPNIILIMADDQGWGDVSYNGHPHLNTPNLDAMAANGAKFNRFYAASAVCSPTRGSVMTGRHPLRYGICHANCGHIKKEEVTLGEMLKEKGYRTGHFGKWHLGTLTTEIVDANRGGRAQHEADYAPPWEHGFDLSFVTESKVPTWNPMITPPSSAGDVNASLTEGEAFGTYYWSGPEQIVHENLEGDDSRIIMDRVVNFVEEATDAQTAFLSVVWFHTPHLPVLTGEENRQQYATLSEDQQHYYGVISAMDAQIGRLRQKLRELDIAENTILFYTSDNGPEGKKVGGRTQGLTKGLKGRKRSLNEGGIRVPGIMEWPGTIEKGVVVDAPCFTSDYFPTIAQILDVDVKKYNRPFDGVSIMPFVRKELKQRSKPLAFSFQNQEALMDHEYKIYSDDGGKNFKLYNIQKDPGEQINLTNENPQKATELTNLWRLWKKSIASSAEGNDYLNNEGAGP
jgi:arylsulfatase A-like enzyme